MLYRETADKIAAYIKERKLSAGTKLPTYRSFSELFGVSLHTVGSAMERLHNRGIVNISPQSGVFVMEEAWKAFYPNAFNWQNYFNKTGRLPVELLKRFSESRRGNGETRSRYVLSNLGLSPEFGYLPMLKDALKKAVLDLPYEHLVIPSEEHFEKYAETIAEYMRSYGVDLPAGSVLPTRGAYHSLLIIALTFFSPGTVCYYVSPSMLDVSGIFDMAGLIKRAVPSGREGIDLDYFSEAVRKGEKAFIVISPELNLSGVQMSLGKRQKLYHFCHTNLIPIIEVDEYRGYLSETLPPVKAFDKHGIVFYIGTFTDITHAFIDAGWIAASEELIERLNLSNISICMMPEIIPHQAIYEILTGGSKGFISNLQNELEERGRELNLLLDEYLGDIAVWDRNSKVFFWVKFPNYIDAQKIAANSEGLTVAEYSKYAFAEKNSVFISTASSNRSEMPDAVRLLSKIARKSMRT
ncbi:MAG: PLP-dependent aminotransferase family protein [Deferribacteraceae bacterium]|jgi:GntR family transcriptional regulator of abcA and norABC|nr:PLP-dependent aminotransferase family protein [Deferribacteraceae bacterium]